jgi:hypothetical protein
MCGWSDAIDLFGAPVSKPARQMDFPFLNHGMKGPELMPKVLRALLRRFRKAAE